MREIIFRGKDPENGKWYEGQYIHLHKTTYCFDVDYAANPDNDIHQIVFERMTDWGLPNQHFRADVDPATVGQHTGLKDKNGKRIFEGDIVYDGFTKDKVVFEDCQWKLVDRHGMWINLFDREVEIIGNIHDNPELIGGAE